VRVIWIRTPLLNVLPAKLARRLKDRAGASALLVKGWFHRGPLVSATEGWWTVVLCCDGTYVSTLGQGGTRASSCWCDLEPGRHRLEFVGSGRSGDEVLLHEEHFEVTAGQVFYLAFLPPAPNRVRRKPNLRSKWRRLTLDETAIAGLRRHWCFPLYYRLPKDRM
jgi:hypothetical protein